MHYIYIFLKNIWSIEQTLFKSLRAPLQSTVSSLFCLLGVSLCMGNLLFFKPPPIRQISSIHQISRGLQSTDSHLPHLPSIWLSWTVQIRICTDLHGCVCTKLPKAIHLESWPFRCKTWVISRLQHPRALWTYHPPAHGSFSMSPEESQGQNGGPTGVWHNLAVVQSSLSPSWWVEAEGRWKRTYLRVQQQCRKVQNQTCLHSPEVSEMKTG